MRWIQRQLRCTTNYGGKSNEELLAGYGFTLDTITEDTLALKIGSDDPNAEAKTHYWAVPSASTKSENDDSTSTSTSRSELLHAGVVSMSFATGRDRDARAARRSSPYFG